MNGLGADFFERDLSGELSALRNRQTTPAKWLFAVCDERFTSVQLSAEGTSFTRRYYADENEMHNGAGSFLNDYSELFEGFITLYHIPDSWLTYGRLKPVLDARFWEWQTGR